MHYSITIAVFILLSLISIFLSSSPFKVHAVDISALFIAFVIPSLIAYKKDIKKSIFIWLLGSVIGVLFWDIFASYVIVKKEIFMGWYIVYPLGVSSIMLLQLIMKYINRQQHNAL